MATTASSIDYQTNRRATGGTTQVFSGNGSDIARSIMIHLVRANAALIRTPTEAGAHIRRAKSLLSAYLDVPETPCSAADTARGGLTHWQVEKIKEHVSDNLEQRISVDELAEIVGLSVGHFFRPFKTSFSVSPHAYVTERRVDKAKTLMLSGEERLAQIAIACGFSDQSHFSHMFRRWTGQTPADWRRHHRNLAPASSSFNSP